MVSLVCQWLLGLCWIATLLAAGKPFLFGTLEHDRSIWWRDNSLPVLLGIALLVLALAGLVTARLRSETGRRRTTERNLQELRIRLEQESRTPFDGLEGQRLREFVAGVSVGMAEVDCLTGRFVRVNNALCLLTGYARDELLGLSVLDLSHHEERAQAAERFAGLARGAAWGGEIERRYVRKDGRVIWVQTHCVVVRGGDGGPPWVAVVFIDQTARKEAEQTLAAWAANSRGQLEFVNRYFCALRAKESGQLLDKATLDLAPPEVAACVQACNRRALAEGQAVGLEENYLRPDGATGIGPLVKFPAPGGDSRTPIGAVGYDVSDRRRAELALRESEERFRATADSVPVLLWTADAEGEWNYFNRCWLDFTGRAPEQEVGVGWVEGVHPDDRERVDATRRAAFAARELLNSEYRLRRHDGAYRWMADRAVPRFLPDGTFAGYIGSTVDVTDRHEAQDELERRASERAAELRASEGRFRALTDALPELVWTFLPDGRCDFVNKAWSDYTGLPPEVAYGTGWMAAVHPGDLPQIQEVWGGSFKKGVPFEIEARYRRGGDGAYRWFMVRAWPQRDEAGAPVWWIGCCTDIDDRKRVAAALEERERNLRVIFETAAVGINLVEPDTGRCLWFNQKYCDITGYAPEELRHLSFSEITHPEDRELEAADRRRLVRENGPPYAVVKRYVRKNGEVIWAQVNVAAARDAAGNLLYTIGVVQDITAQRSAEEALTRARDELERRVQERTAELRESEERFRGAFTHAAIGMAIVAPDGHWLRVNSSLCAILGHSEEELLDGTFQNVTYPDDLEQDLAQVARVLAGEIPTYQMEKRYIHKDGHLVWASLSVSLVRSPTGAPLYFISQIQDIGDRKRAEEERDRFFTQSLQMMVVGDFNGYPRRINQACERILGYSSEELMAMPLMAIAHPDDREVAAKSIERVVRGETASAVEIRCRNKDGSYRWVVWDSVPHPDGTRFYATGRDVTDWKLAEEEVRRARAQLMDAIESLDAGLVMYGPDGRLVVCNSRYRELYAPCASHILPGTPYEEIVRAVCQAGIYAHTGMSPEAWVARRLANHQSPGEPMEQMLADRWVRISDRRTSDGGVVSLQTDITALKRAQEAAEAASRAKSEFLANMSHEIRTPMNGILGMTELVLDTQLTQDQREFLGLVKESGENLLRIINDILDFSKVEAGRLELDAVPFRLRELLTAAIKPLSFRAAQKRVGLFSQVALDVPDELIGDPGRIRQVLVNLIGNAVKFTDSGDIRVTIDRGPGDGPQPPSDTSAEGDISIRFSVTDTGPGIPLDRQGSLFEAFSPVDNSLTRQHGGTGLGLAISQKLVGLMGGRIQVKSALGVGTQFYFTIRLPIWTGTGTGGPPGQDAATAPTLHAAGEATGTPAALRLNVLVAEDQEVNQRLIVRMLESRGHDVALAANGQEALDRLSLERFDVILMDVQMPVLDGLSATRAIREREQKVGRHTPVIALTAYAMAGDRERCLAAGCDGYLSKPVRKEDLYPLLESLASPVTVPALTLQAANQAGGQPPVQTAFDRESALARVDGDAAFLAELIQLFFQHWPEQWKALREAATAQDATAVQRIAHTAKGTLAALGATASFEIAAAIDRLGKAGSLEGVGPLLNSLEREIDRFAEVTETRRPESIGG